MMKCPNCGHTENNENNRFCAQCGEPLTTLKTPIPPVSASSQLSSTSSSLSPSDSSSSKTKHLFFGVGIGLLVAFLGIACFFFGFHSNSSNVVALVNANSEESSQTISSESQEMKTSEDEKSEKDTPSAPTVIVQVPQTQTPTPPTIVAPIITQDPLEGTYVANYNMKVRTMPDYNATSTSRITQGSYFEVIGTASGSNYSIWGQLSDGNWICLQDADQIFCRKV